jgi:RNA-directed DNA polymerase
VVARQGWPDGPRGEGMSRTPPMNDRGKSDSPIVPEKPPNKACSHAAEALEGRGLAKGNAGQDATRRTQRRGSVSAGLDRVREVANQDKDVRFTALLHHVTLDRLKAAYYALKRKASAGVDGVTWSEYGEQLEENIQDLHSRVHRGAYRAKPARRVYIPKTDGRRRPLGIVTLEDKVVQRAVAEVLNAVYEQDFLGISYGFRPGRSQHNALDALASGIRWKKVGWVLDADIRGFFDAIDHEWLMRIVAHRIGDQRVLRLIRKWLKAGVLEEGNWPVSKAGTPQGAVLSPLLANIYLHYAFDLWAQRWRKRSASGDVVVVRYADDIVVGFQHHDDAELFREEFAARLDEFGLELNGEKTHLLEFGRFATRNRKRRGEGKPETFEFLGFTHVCGTTRSGKFRVMRRTSSRRMGAKLHDVKAELRRRMHHPVPEQGAWLRRVVQGYFNYHAVPGNIQAMQTFRHRVAKHWHQTLRRRSQNDRTTWARTGRLVEYWLPPARNLHPWPEERLLRHYPRQEPGALCCEAGYVAKCSEGPVYSALEPDARNIIGPCNEPTEMRGRTSARCQCASSARASASSLTR